MRWLYSKGINEKRVYALEKITSSLKKCTDKLTKHYICYFKQNVIKKQTQK